jgi:hypothetical protein
MQQLYSLVICKVYNISWNLIKKKYAKFDRTGIIEIYVSHSIAEEALSTSACYAVSTGKYLQTFWRSMLLPNRR